jgi:hypothetical protein
MTITYPDPKAHVDSCLSKITWSFTVEGDMVELVFLVLGRKDTEY